MMTAHMLTPALSRSSCPGRARLCSPLLGSMLIGAALACSGTIDTQDTAGSSPNNGVRSGTPTASGTAPAPTGSNAAGTSSPGELTSPDVGGISSGASAAGGGRRSSRAPRVNADDRNDAGADDAGALDAGALDAGALDAGLVDAGVLDAAL